MLLCVGCMENRRPSRNVTSCRGVTCSSHCMASFGRTCEPRAVTGGPAAAPSCEGDHHGCQGQDRSLAEDFGTAMLSANVSNDNRAHAREYQ